MAKNKQLNDFAKRIWGSLVDDLAKSDIIEKNRTHIPTLKEDDYYIHQIYLGMLDAKTVKGQETSDSEGLSHEVTFNDKPVEVSRDMWMALVMMKNEGIDIRSFNNVAISLDISTVQVKAMVSRWDELTVLWGSEWK